MMSDKPVHLAERAAQRLRVGSSPGIASLLTAASGFGKPQTLPQTPVNFPAPSRPFPLLGRQNLQNAGLTDGRNGRSRIAEEFSVLQSEMLYERDEVGPNGKGVIVMVTSARQREGKSFVALNLAASMAHNSGSDVMLVDTDTKDGNLTSLLGLSDRPGLLNLATGSSVAAGSYVADTPIDRLTVLPVGQAQTGEGALHAVASAASISEALRANFPRMIIVLDVAACLASSDSATLSPFVDHSVVVVEADRTKRADLARTVELLRGCPHVSLMMNKVSPSPQVSFGDYYN